MKQLTEVESEDFELLVSEKQINDGDKFLMHVGNDWVELTVDRIHEGRRPETAEAAP